MAMKLAGHKTESCIDDTPSRMTFTCEWPASGWMG
jgi:hypothetical protein